MPVTPTYPGVYIEEVPSGVRTITGVATSIAAMVGRAKRGPVNEPVVINSYADFERIFGGLWTESALGFAVNDFYLNGGSQAVIVRLYHAENGGGVNRNGGGLEGEEGGGGIGGEDGIVVGGSGGNQAAKSKAELKVNGLLLQAANEGTWGNKLRARVDHDVSEDIAERFEVDLFNLTVRDTASGVTEQFRNVTVAESPRRVDRVLANESRLVATKGNLPGSIPAAHAEPQPGEDIWEEDTLSTPVADEDKASDGEELEFNDFIGQGGKMGLYALEKADLFNILCIPPHQLGGDIESGLVTAAMQYCEKRRAMFLVDPPSNWIDKGTARAGLGSIESKSKNSALFFPRLKKPNPLHEDQMEDFVPCGAVAGIFARTDVQRGVWKAPAGLEATLVGVPKLTVPLTDAENGELNPLGINCLRTMPAAGRVVWGSRTLQGDDRLASEWKYIPVRRTALFIEESLYRGTHWVVFEPNDEPLWAQIRLSVGSFMHRLFRQGAFQGSSPRDAYYVKCDHETTTQDDIDLGIVNIEVGFAPLKPAEFVIIKIQQMAGQRAV